MKTLKSAMQMLRPTIQRFRPTQDDGSAKPWAKGPDRSGTTTQRGYGWEWQKLRQRVLKRDMYLCQCQDCKGVRVTPASEVDHIINKAQGGSDDMVNLQAINTECHKRKTATESTHARANQQNM